MNLIDKIHEASKLFAEIDDEMFKLRSEYLNFLLEYNPIGRVPEFRIIKNMPETHYEFSLYGAVEDSVYFSGEQFEMVYFFRMPLEYIASPGDWLSRHKEEQGSLLGNTEPQSFPCPRSVFGCNCEGDFDKHCDY